MITHDDLLRWASAGLAPEPPPPAPEPPNFRGDVVKFTRWQDGEVIGSGHMHRDQIAKLQKSGVDLRIEDDDHPGLPPSPQGFVPIEPETALRAAIAQALKDSDHYFLADRVGAVDPGKLKVWEYFRGALRAAQKLEGLAAIAAALPLASPAGNDPFAEFRRTNREAGIDGTP